jgi:hypothetical protein
MNSGTGIIEFSVSTQHPAPSTIFRVEGQTMPDSDFAQSTEEQAHRRRTKRSHTCPACGGRSLAVIHRRPIDHLVSRFYPIRRYRCRNRDCRWEGNLPSSKGRKEVRRFWQGLFVWGMGVVLAGAAFFLALWYVLQKPE